ncbi:hypothetical protein YC2023_098312 [Brassica napus]
MNTKRAFLNRKFIQTPLTCFCSLAPQEIRRRYGGSIEFGCEESLNESEDVFQTNGMPRYLRTESGARVSVRRSPRKESSVSFGTVNSESELIK